MPGRPLESRPPIRFASLGFCGRSDLVLLGDLLPQSGIWWEECQVVKRQTALCLAESIVTRAILHCRELPYPGEYHITRCSIWPLSIVDVLHHTFATHLIVNAAAAVEDVESGWG